MALEPNEKEVIRSFDWEKEFPGIKFDVIVGNPPYFKIKTSDKIKISEQYEKMRSPGSSPNMALLFLSKRKDWIGTPKSYFLSR